MSLVLAVFISFLVISLSISRYFSALSFTCLAISKSLAMSHSSIFQSRVTSTTQVKQFYNAPDFSRISHGFRQIEMEFVLGGTIAVVKISVLC